MNTLATVPADNTAAPTNMVLMALERNADVATLERLIAVQERADATEAKRAYVVAMSNFRRDCPVITKTRTAHTNKYAGLAESLEQIKNPLSENGFSHSWTTKQDGDAITVTCIVTHVMGHSEETTLTASPDTTGSKNSIQAIGSAVSYLQRYTIFSILGLASADDTDGNVPSTETAGLQAAIDSLGTAQNLDQLEATFRGAWKRFPKSRKALTDAKDARKKPLLQAEEVTAREKPSQAVIDPEECDPQCRSTSEGPCVGCPDAERDLYLEGIATASAEEHQAAKDAEE